MIIHILNLENIGYRWKLIDSSDEYSEFYNKECKIVRSNTKYSLYPSIFNYLLLTNNLHKTVSGYEKIRIEKLTKEKYPEYFL